MKASGKPEGSRVRGQAHQAAGNAGSRSPGETFDAGVEKDARLAVPAKILNQLEIVLRSEPDDGVAADSVRAAGLFYPVEPGAGIVPVELNTVQNAVEGERKRVLP